jgi:hypothetical protein
MLDRHTRKPTALSVGTATSSGYPSAFNVALAAQVWSYPSDCHKHAEGSEHAHGHGWQPASVHQKSRYKGSVVDPIPEPFIEAKIMRGLGRQVWKPLVPEGGALSVNLEASGFKLVFRFCNDVLESLG